VQGIGDKSLIVVAAVGGTVDYFLRALHVCAVVYRMN
jgi:hypothetical protein